MFFERHLPVEFAKREVLDDSDFENLLFVSHDVDKDCMKVDDEVEEALLGKTNRVSLACVVFRMHTDRNIAVEHPLVVRRYGYPRRENVFALVGFDEPERIGVVMMTIRRKYLMVDFADDIVDGNLSENH